jgi:hypothetical protein
MANTIKVRPVTDYSLAGLRAGDQVMLWGHTFEMQKDRCLVCDMDATSARIELKVGRCIRYQVEEPEPKPVEKSGPIEELGNYYGAGDLETLRKKIEAMDVTQIQTFTEKHLSFSWPMSMSKEKMVDKLCKAVAEMKGV